MNKKQRRLVLFLSFLITILGVILADPIAIGICPEGYYSCDNIIGEGIGMPFMLFGSISFLLSFILLFTREQIFNSWLRFSKYYLPITAILIFLMPAVDSTIGGFDREFMTWFLAGIFFIVSLGIIIFRRRVELVRPLSGLHGHDLPRGAYTKIHNMIDKTERAILRQYGKEKASAKGIESAFLHLVRSLEQLEKKGYITSTNLRELLHIIY